MKTIDKNSQSSLFGKMRKTDENGASYWLARDLSKALGYSDYNLFIPVIEKAEKACTNSGQNIQDHFEEFHDIDTIGYDKQDLDSMRLSRYACYLIVQNADPANAVVSNAQTYFALQARIAEIKQMDGYSQLSSEEKKRLFLREELKRHNMHLASAAKEAGVIESVDYGIFQNHGYEGLYGGLDAKGIHAKKGLKKSEHILDHMGSTELAANLFCATQTEEKLNRENIKGNEQADKAHFEVGAKVRKTIEEMGGTMPENLPVANSIKLLERKQMKEIGDGGKRE